MSELAKTARDAAKKKAESYVKNDPHIKVDASSWTPTEMMETGEQTGPKPLNPREYKRGGTVDGKKTATHTGRKPRADGGHTDEAADRALIKRMVKKSDLTGKKDGGRAARADGGKTENWMNKSKGSEYDDRMYQALLKKHGEEKSSKGLMSANEYTNQGRNNGPTTPAYWGTANAAAKGLIKPSSQSVSNSVEKPKKTSSSPNYFNQQKINAEEAKMRLQTRASGGRADMRGAHGDGGREARATGGRTKGKTNIVIAINPGHAQQQQTPQPAGMPARPVVPPGQAIQAPPMPPQGMPPQPGAVPPAMPRKTGGRTIMTAGAGSGEGRLEKIELQKRK